MHLYHWVATYTVKGKSQVSYNVQLAGGADEVQTAVTAKVVAAHPTATKIVINCSAVPRAMLLAAANYQEG